MVTAASEQQIEQDRLTALANVWEVARTCGFHATPAASALLNCLGELVREQQAYLAVAEQASGRVSPW